MPWVDKLRVTVVAAVVVAHAALAYVVPIPWYYEERTSSRGIQIAFSVPVLLAAVFGLAPLFVVGGWLSSISLAHHGTAHFVGSRMLRLGVPALVYLLLIDPVGDFLGSRAQGKQASLVQLLVAVRGSRDLGPMWFVLTLLVFSLAYAGWRAVRPVRPPEAALGVPVLVTLALAIAVLDFVVWLQWPYLAVAPWNLGLPRWPQAAGMFVLGVLAGERGCFTRLPATLVRRCGWLLVGGLTAILALIGYTMSIGGAELMTGSLHWSSMAFAVLDGATAVVLVVWITGWFQTRWNALAGPVMNKAGRASYATYVLHPLVLIGLSVAMRGVPWAPEVKFLVVAATGIPASFAVGYMLTRVPGVNRVV
jgi:peptidoglycan/LPS O-acetylase OafA/YrhL